MKNGKSVARRVAASTVGITIAAGAALAVSAGAASASTTVDVYARLNGSGYGTAFACNYQRALEVAAHNRDGAGYFYGPCVQAPNAALVGYPVTGDKWYYTLQKR